MIGTEKKALVFLIAIAWLPAISPGAEEEDVFHPLFNGKDLSGWVNVNTHEST